jgi:hypothetical protein
MNVTLNAWKNGETTSFFTRVRSNVETPLIVATAMMWSLFKEYSGELFTEEYEVEKMDLGKIEIIFS